jgi:hypothetical protein
MLFVPIMALQQVKVVATGVDKPKKVRKVIILATSFALHCFRYEKINAKKFY